MTTRTKLNIACYTASIMMLLNVFYMPLHIPEPLHWALLLGAFVPLGFLFYYIKQQKLEKQAGIASAELPAQPPTDEKRIIKRRLVLMMVLGSASSLCAPLWMPVTGTTLGPVGDFVCGLIGAAVVCLIVGLRLRKI